MVFSLQLGHLFSCLIQYKAVFALSFSLSVSAIFSVRPSIHSLFLIFGCFFFSFQVILPSLWFTLFCLLQGFSIFTTELKKRKQEATLLSKDRSVVKEMNARTSPPWLADRQTDRQTGTKLSLLCGA